MPRGVRVGPTVKTCKMTTQFRTEYCVCNLVADTRIIFTRKWSTAHGWYGLPYSANRWFFTQLLSFLVASVYNSINCDVMLCNLVVMFQCFGCSNVLDVFIASNLPRRYSGRNMQPRLTQSISTHETLFAFPHVYTIFNARIKVNSWDHFILSLP